MVLVLATMVCTSCAIKVRPGGGPQDSTTATIIKTYPVSGTRSMQNDEVVFFFDDYVDRSINSAISIQPRTRINTSYAGDEITVSFLEPLSPNTTYSVTVGTNWKDLSGNSPKEAYTLLFSTGSIIDTGFISGTISNPNWGAMSGGNSGSNSGGNSGGNAKGLVVLCYSHADTLQQSFTSKTEAAYVMPIGSSGAFSVMGLPDGLYRIVGVIDENNNSLVDAGEQYATATKDVLVQNGTSENVNLIFGAAPDISAPQLVQARSLSSTRHFITFSEPIVVKNVSAAVTIADSAGNAVNSKWWWVSRSQPERLVVITEELNSSSSYTISVLRTALTDTAGNTNLNEDFTSTFRVHAASDTTTISIGKISPRDSTKNVSILSTFSIPFSDAVDTSATRVQASLTSAKGNATVATRWLNAQELLCEPQSPLASSTWYNLKMSLTGLRSATGYVVGDTTIEASILTADRIDSGTIHGSFADSADFGAPYLLQFITRDGKVETSLKVENNTLFAVPAIVSGDYRVRVVRDVNQNGKYDHGTISPFTYSEKWYTFPLNLTVKKRWTVDDVRLVIH